MTGWIEMKKILLFLLLIIGTLLLSQAVLGYDIRPIWKTYHSTDETYKILKDLAADHSSVMSYEVIGKSILGKDILMFKIGNPNGGKFMFDGRIHGPEDCGTEDGIEFIRWVLESNDPDAKQVLRNNYLLFIPVINVDTAEKRQNLRRSYTSSDGVITKVVYGVDLNRNFVTGFGSSGSSDPADDYDYRGISAGSEPETKAVRSAMQKYLKNDGHSIYLNVHCGMQMLRYYSDTATTKKVVQGITTISAEKGVSTNSYYPPRRSGGGGFVMSDGASFSGGNGWILEVTTWDKLPATLNDYLTVWHTKVFPIYLAMAQAVEITSNSTCISSWQCGTWSNCVASTQSRTCIDLNKCAVNKIEKRSCTVSTNLGLKGSWDLSTNYFDKIAKNTALSYGKTIFVSDSNYGSVLKLNNSNSYLKIIYTNGSLKPQNGFTVDVKVKFDSVRHSHIVKDAKSYLLQRVYVNATTSRFQAGVYSGNKWYPILSSSTDLQTDKWYRVTYTYDKNSGVFKLYINKKLDMQKTWSGVVDASSSSEIFIGNSDSFDRWLKGGIRDLRIYNLALSNTEISNLV
jgi:hypothetical protein